MMIEERDRSYLIRILEHCNRIEKASIRFGNSFENYCRDADFRDVVCMNLFQIGELSNRISESVQERYPEIPWRQMYGIRNILAHAYIKIDDKVVWETIKKDIPYLKEKLLDII